MKSTHYFYYSTENPKGVPYFKAPHQLYTFAQINNIIRTQVSLKPPLKAGFSRQISDKRIPPMQFRENARERGHRSSNEISVEIFVPPRYQLKKYFFISSSLLLFKVFTLCIAALISLSAAFAIFSYSSCNSIGGYGKGYSFNLSISTPVCPAVL